MLYCLYYSPCGSTQEYAVKVAETLGPNPIYVDLTRSDGRLDFQREDIVIFAAPVYGGRLPVPLVEKLERMRGDLSHVITMVVYGNRAYDDALLELNSILVGDGFEVFASAAFVARHVFHPEVAADRPDKQDFQEAEAFTNRAKYKYDEMDYSEPKVPGSKPYREFAGMQVAPIADPASCFKCGTCATNCPVGAISKEDPTQTDALKCIDCMRCVQNCPSQGRVLPQKVQEMLLAKLSPLAGVRKANEFFY